MNWYMGDGTPISDEGLKEDPLKVAAKEMVATTAAFAQQKAELSKAGLGALMGGSAPSPDALMAAFRNNGELPASHDPYAGLTRDEKIALIDQLQKAKAARSQPAPEPGPSDMVDPIEELSKGGPYIGPRGGKWADPQHTVAWEGAGGGEGHAPEGSATPEPEEKKEEPAKHSFSAGDIVSGKGPYKPGDTLSHKHDSPETAHVIADYPYGSQRTEKRVWTETNKNGQRAVSQTKNPKTGAWNKPDASTYSDAHAMHFDEQGHIQHSGFSLAYTDGPKAKEFLDRHGEALHPEVKSKIRFKIDYDKNMTEKKQAAEGGDLKYGTPEYAQAHKESMKAAFESSGHGEKMIAEAKKASEEAKAKKEAAKAKKASEPKKEKKPVEVPEGAKVVGHTKGGDPILAHDPKFLVHHEQHPHGIYQVENHGAGYHAVYFQTTRQKRPEHIGFSNDLEGAKARIKSHTEWQAKFKKSEEFMDIEDFLEKAAPEDDQEMEIDENEPVDDLDALQKAADGEGSRGGKIIGHTLGGKPIYAPSKGHIDRVREHVNLQKRTAKGKLAEHAHAHLSHEAKDYSPEDHKAAAEAHGKESRDYKNSDKVRAFHASIAEAHEAKATGSATPAQVTAAKQKKAAESREKLATKKEAARPKNVIATAPGGHQIKNTHHVRTGIGGPSLHEGSAASARHGQAFGVAEEPIETESGAHLTHEQHKDIAAHHNERAHHHAVQATVHSSVVERINNKRKVEQHQFAAAHHEAEAKKKAPAPNPNQGELFSKASDLDDFIHKSESGHGESTMENAADILNDFLVKAEGQGGMPEAGDPPSSMPTNRRAVDGGEVAEAGKTDGAQSPPAADVESTAMRCCGNGCKCCGGKGCDGCSPGRADLQAQTPGEPMQKSDQWVDWDQAGDDGEYLRAQLTSQLLNKSMDVSVGMGVKAQKKVSTVPTQEKFPNVYFQKGGSIAYVDSEDQRIEKAMERAGGALTFSQGSQANIGAPIQHDSACPNCEALVKSYLSSCTECGASLHGVVLAENQGLLLSKSVAATLVPGEEDDVQIG